LIYKKEILCAQCVPDVVANVRSKNNITVKEGFEE
jgi:hypothetical protein